MQERGSPNPASFAPTFDFLSEREIEHSGANMELMVEDAELDESRLDLALGPDVPSKMVFLLLPACAVALIAIIAVTVSWLIGPAVVAAAAMAWYGWRAGRRTGVELTAEWVRVELPIRSIQADWGQVSAASVGSGLQLKLTDGSRFTSSLYGRVLGADILARYFALGRGRLNTSRSLEDSLRTHVRACRSGGSVSRRWHRPSGQFWMLVVAVAVVAEVVALSA